MAACRILENPVGKSASPFGTYTNDLLGNRTLWVTRGDDPSYTWDLLNRLTKFQSAVTWPKTSYVEYQYRADGMRVKKFNNWVDPDETTKYFYDGQMGIEDVWDDGTDDLVTRYGIGARGIEMISKIENGGAETFGFPLYDTHGNMLATLGRDGSSYTTGNWQSYDVWGSVRSGSSSEQQGYVANLGHRADPESFLTYMRARYYEPHTGRFISEDPARDRVNWFRYCDNDPVGKRDGSGQSPESERLAWLGSVLIFLGLMMMGGGIGIGSVAFANNESEIRSFMQRAQNILHFNLDDRMAVDQIMQEFEEGLKKNGEMPQTRRMLGSLATALIGAFFTLYGTLLWTDADFVDPYSTNLGLFELFL
jgi:RHS repeat-associated protein